MTKSIFLACDEAGGGIRGAAMRFYGLDLHRIERANAPHRGIEIVTGLFLADGAAPR